MNRTSLLRDFLNDLVPPVANRVDKKFEIVNDNAKVHSDGGFGVDRVTWEQERRDTKDKGQVVEHAKPLTKAQLPLEDPPINWYTLPRSRMPPETLEDSFNGRTTLMEISSTSVVSNAPSVDNNTNPTVVTTPTDSTATT